MKVYRVLFCFCPVTWREIEWYNWSDGWPDDDNPETTAARHRAIARHHMQTDAQGFNVYVEMEVDE